MSEPGFLDLVRKILLLPEQASTIAPQVDALHYAVIGTTMLGATAVAAVTIWRMFRWARARDDEPTPRLRSGPWLMVAKIGGPLTLFLAFWLLGFRQYVVLHKPPEGSFDVYVTAKQWMWKFAYPSGPTSVSTLTVPVGRPVRLVMTSRDVIHSFYVAEFRVKQDVLPGRFTTAWFEVTKPGVYEILCAEYCGTSHSGMRGSVVALSEGDFAKWLERQGPQGATGVEDVEGAVVAAKPGNMAVHGADVARRNQCLACHTLDGQRHIGPSFRGLYLSSVPLEDGRTVLADEAYLSRSMMEPAVDVHRGFAPVMPSFRGVLAAPDVAALIEYIKSLRFAAPEPGVALPEVQPKVRDAGLDVEIPPYAPGLGPAAGAVDAKEGSQ